MGISHHDAYREGAAQNVAYNAAAGASTQSSAFGSQTYWIRVSAVGVVNGTNDGVRIKVGDNPTASATTTLLPLNWVEWIKCTPGQKAAALSNNTTAGSLSVTELSD
jgi:hypothetical protein